MPSALRVRATPFAALIFMNFPPHRLDRGPMTRSRVLGQSASPATLNVPNVRRASRAPSCLVWLATCPSTEGHITLTHYHTVQQPPTTARPEPPHRRSQRDVVGG